jgi:uncharacterized membrane protein YgdD (TMEM256/DUF423 family)
VVAAVLLVVVGPVNKLEKLLYLVGWFIWINLLHFSGILRCLDFATYSDIMNGELE